MKVTQMSSAQSRIPLAGSMFALKRDALGTLLQARSDHGDVVRFTSGVPRLRADVYCAFSAAGVQQVLAAESANFRKETAVYNEVRTSFGNGMLTSLGEDWVRQRRLVQPLFTSRRVEGYAEAFTSEATKLVDAWRLAPQGIVDLAPEMSSFTLRTVGNILFGADLKPDLTTIQQGYQSISQYSVRRGYAPVKFSRRWPTRRNRRAAAAQSQLYAVCDTLIAQRVAAGAGGEDLLSLLIAAGDSEDDRLSREEIRDQVLIFLLAGQETTATSLAFALHLLAQHPEVQRQARAQVDQVLGSRAPTVADIEALPYLMMVLKEAMRLYPAGPVTARRAGADTRIEGHFIPAGADVILSAWVTHRHPAYWDDPERFDPTRFTPDREATRPRYAWFPFGGGPRACIGQHFALLNAMLPLATVLQAYELDAADAQPPLTAGITLAVLGTMRCRLTPRSGG